MAGDEGISIEPTPPKLHQQQQDEAPLSSRSIRDVERTDGISVFDSTSSKYMSQSYRHAAGASYVLAMGVCGIVLVALSSSLKDLAKQVDKESTEVSLECLAVPPFFSVRLSSHTRRSAASSQPRKISDKQTVVVHNINSSTGSAAHCRHSSSQFSSGLLQQAAGTGCVRGFELLK